MAIITALVTMIAMKMIPTTITPYSGIRIRRASSGEMSPVYTSEGINPWATAYAPAVPSTTRTFSQRWPMNQEIVTQSASVSLSKSTPLAFP